jgi:hypothetical protein
MLRLTRHVTWYRHALYVPYNTSIVGNISGLNIADSRYLSIVLHGEANTVHAGCFRNISIMERRRPAHVVMHPI